MHEDLSIAAISALIGAAGGAGAALVGWLNFRNRVNREHSVHEEEMRVRTQEATDRLIDTTGDVVDILRKELGIVYVKVKDAEAEVVRLQAMVERLVGELDSAIAERNRLLKELKCEQDKTKLWKSIAIDHGYEEPPATDKE